MSISMRHKLPQNHIDVQDADSPASAHAYPCQEIIQTTTRNLYRSDADQVRNQSSGHPAVAAAAAAVDHTLHLDPADMWAASIVSRFTLPGMFHVMAPVHDVCLSYASQVSDTRKLRHLDPSACDQLGCPDALFHAGQRAFHFGRNSVGTF